MITHEHVRLLGGEMSEQTVAEINKDLDKIMETLPERYRDRIELDIYSLILDDVKKREGENILSLLKNEK